MKQDKMANPAHSSWSGGWATLRDLEIVQAVIDSGSVTAAAEKLSITQPAISRTLNRLEERAGRVLFTRDNNRLTPTADAMLLYDEIATISASFARLTHFQRLPGKSTIRVLAAPTIAYGFLNEASAQFLKQHPDTAIQIEAVRSEKILESIVNDYADIAIADSLTENFNYNFSSIPLRKTRIVCAIPAEHPLSQKEFITADDLNNINFIALAKNNIGRAMIERALRKSSATPNQVAEVGDIQTALSFVHAGVGVSLVSAFPASLSMDPAIVYRDFRPEMISQLTFFTKKTTNNHNIQTYIDFIHRIQPPADLFSSPI